MGAFYVSPTFTTPVLPQQCGTNREPVLKGARQLDKPQWKSGEEVTRWCKDFRSWLLALLEMMRRQIQEAHTDALLPESIILDRTLAELKERGIKYQYLIDDDFSYSIRRKLKAIQNEILAHEIAAGQEHTRERRIVEQAIDDFQTIALLDMSTTPADPTRGPSSEFHP